MAENTTDETVDYNSEGNSQGPTNPKDRRTGYSSVSELLRANYLNTLKKGATSVQPLFKAARAGQLPVQKEQAKQGVKPAFSMKDVEAAAMAEMKPRVEAVKPVVKAKEVTGEKPKGIVLEKSKANINTYENALIAIDNQAKLYANQLPADMPMRDVFVAQKKEDFLSRFKKGELRIAKDDKGFPVLKNVIDGTIANFIDGVQNTLNANSQVADFDMMDKDEQISFMKGSKRVQIPTIGEAGKPNKTRYIDRPMDKDLGTVGMERRGAFAETVSMMGGVMPDIATGIAVGAIPGLGQMLSPAVVGAVQGKRQQFDSMNQAFQKAKQSGLSDDDAYEVATNFWNSKVPLLTGAAEGAVSQYLGNKVLNKFADLAPARDLKSFGQATKAFLKDAASNGKELALSGFLDGAVAYSMEKVRGGSDDSAEEQFKAEFLTQLGFAAIGGAVSVPKYVKSYAYNAISNLDNQTIYNNMVAMEQTGLVPEGTAKKAVDDVNKFRDTKAKVMVSNQDAVPTVAGLTMKAEALQEQIKNTPETNISALNALNTELEQVNERISRAQASDDPLTEEVDDKTGLNIKNKQYATTISEGQESTATSSISQYQGTQGIQNQASNEADNRYSAFGSKTQQQKIVIDAQNADTVSIENPITPADTVMSQAPSMISALKAIKPNLKVAGMPSIQEYGDVLVQTELDNGETVSKQREKALRGSNGAYDPISDTIYLNLENINKRGKTSTLFHEGAHPIINIIAEQNSEAVGTLYNQLRDLSETLDGVNGVLAFGDGYSIYGDDTVKSEAIVEFIARVADGQIELPVDQPTVMQNILDVIRGFLDIIGLGTDINSLDDIKSIAAKIKEAFQTGKEIIVVSETSGSATEAGITSDTIVINSGNIKPTERGPNKEGLNLEIAERNFDEKNLKFIDISDIDGANAFIFAADKAVSAFVKSPSGYVHEFNGGVGYSYQDGTGVWAFTTKAAAQKFLNRAKASDGVGLIMSQKEEGITGSYDFYGYMIGELNNAIDKGVPEKDLVKYLDSKLDTNVKKGQTFRQLLASKGKKTNIESIADLENLMPIEGPSKFSYDQRGGFTKKVFSAFTEKNFGIPRLETALDISNDPLVKSAEYGDIVAAIQIDKNSPIVDTRTDNRFKNHPSYPFVVTGTPIGIFNKFYDVRDIAPSFIPASKEANQTPLGQRGKPQAAKSAMGAQPIIAVRKQLALQQEGGTRKSAKQTAKENARTEADAAASFAYNINAKKRAQESIEKTGLVTKIKNVYKDIKLGGIENQTTLINLLRNKGEAGAVSESLLTTSRGFGAQSALISEDLKDSVYGGLSDKNDIEVLGNKTSEVELLNQLISARRIVAIQDMVQDKFNELQEMRAQMKKLRSKAKKEALQVKIDAAVEYLQDRKVLGRKYNPQTQTTTEYLQNYQVGSTVDATGKKVADNAGFAKKRIELLQKEIDNVAMFDGATFEDLNNRADKMFNTFKKLMDEKLENGLVSKEQHEFYTKYDYVPITYIDKILKDENPEYTRVLSKNPNQLRKAVLTGGAEGDILTDYDTVFQVFAAGHYKSISNNRAALGLVKFAESVPDNGMIEIVNPLVDDEGEVRLDMEGNPVYPKAPEGKSYIFYYEDGQRKALLAIDEIAEQWNARYIQSDEVNTLANITFASLAQKIFTGKNPGFGIFQMIALDPITAAVATDVFAPSVPVAYAQIALGGVDKVGWRGSIQQVIKRGDKYRLAAKWGAFTEMNAGKELESSLLSKEVVDGTGYEKLINNASKYSSKPVEFIDKLIDATGLGKVSDVTEKATRLIIFDRARVVFTEKFAKENGRQPNTSEMNDIYAKAAHEARRSSDFARGGSIIKPASRLIIYLNSTVRTGVSVTDQIKKNPGRAAYQLAEMLSIGGMLTAYSAGVLNMAWEDDEEKKKKKAAWDALSEYQKLNYLNIYVGGDVPERAFVKVPLPPVYKNFWVAGMMGFESKVNNAIYSKADYVGAIANANPFGDITEIPAKLPPGAAAMMAYNNLDLFTKRQIVKDEADIPDNYEEGVDESVSTFYKKIGNMTGLSPQRMQAAGQKIYGQPERNPLIYLPKIAFESAIELASGAPVSIKNDIEKDWKGAIFNGLSLQKRIFAGTPNYYKSLIEGDLLEIEYLRSKAFGALLANKEGSQEEYDNYNKQIESKFAEIRKTLEPVKKNYPSLYNKMVTLSSDKRGGVVGNISKSVSEDMKRKYIKKNYDQNVYQAYIINDAKIRAKYIFDQASDMDAKEKNNYFGLLYNLGLMNADNPTGIEYMKLAQPKNK
jgi:hypothetical protein